VLHQSGTACSIGDGACGPQGISFASGSLNGGDLILTEISIRCRISGMSSSAASLRGSRALASRLLDILEIVVHLLCLSFVCLHKDLRDDSDLIAIPIR